MDIGLMAHDSKKELMQNFCIAYKRILSRHDIYSTGDTGRLVEDVTNLPIHKFLPGQLGGVRQMCAPIDCNQMDDVIFLRDINEPESGSNDFLNVIELCDVNNIPVATNIASAELLVLAIERGDLSWRDLYK